MIPVPPIAAGFAERLRARPLDELGAFAEAEIHSGRPYIFAADGDTAAFQAHVAGALGIPDAAGDVLIVGSARTGFSLDPDRAFEPFGEGSDIDVAVVHSGLFDRAWQAMLGWDYLTMRARSYAEQRWLWNRHGEIFSGWCNPPDWNLRERGGIALSFPAELKPLRDFSYQWFSTFRSLARYRHHAEISRRRVSSRLYRSRQHAAMYHALGLRLIRARLIEPAQPDGVNDAI
jgi:hypothetical protein